MAISGLAPPPQEARMPKVLHRTAELCFDLEKAQSLAAVREVLQQAARLFGASFYFMVMRSGKSISPPVQLVLTTYPMRFQRYFDEQRAIEYDPVVMHALTIAGGSFRWDGLYKTERELALHQVCVECGMEFGFSCGDRGADGSVALLCFCGSKPIAPHPEHWEHTAAGAVLLAASAHRAMSRMAHRHHSRQASGKEGLSNAELQALQMTASAMTATQIATLMGVKPGTVRYYLDRAAGKLGAGSRKEAVAKAIAQDIVDTRHFPMAGFSGSTADFKE